MIEGIPINALTYKRYPKLVMVEIMMNEIDIEMSVIYTGTMRDSTNRPKLI